MAFNHRQSMRGDFLHVSKGGKILGELEVEKLTLSDFGPAGIFGTVKQVHLTDANKNGTGNQATVSYGTGSPNESIASGVFPVGTLIYVHSYLKLMYSDLKRVPGEFFVATPFANTLTLATAHTSGAATLSNTSTIVSMGTLPTYASDSAADSGGLESGDLYINTTSNVVSVKT
mgnify:CR=1 FL=1|tara:strand:+ start:2637 stop:3158 length:522 start_codon:yes stop_codon:yes gene_type:complete